jgi:hypothetical protein
MKTSGVSYLATTTAPGVRNSQECEANKTIRPAAGLVMVL